MLGQTRQQFGRRLLQEARGKLMQQAADFFGRIDEQARLIERALADGARAHLRVFEQACQMRQVGEPDRRRTAGKRMGHRDRRLADRAVQLHRPLRELGRQAPRQLVGFVEINVEQRDADAQWPDDLDVVFRRLGDRLGFERRGGFGGRRQLGHRGERRRHRRRLQALEQRLGNHRIAQIEVDQIERQIGQRHLGNIGQRQRLGRTRVEGVEQRLGVQVQRLGVAHRGREVGGGRRVER